MAKTRRHAKSDDNDLRLRLDGQVTLTRLEQAIGAWSNFLRDVGQDVAGVSGRDAVRYVITDVHGGSLDLVVRPQPARKQIPPAIMPRVSKAITSGIRSLERSARRPKHFTNDALVSLRELASLAGPETPAVKVSNGTGDAVALSSRLITHIDAVLAPDIESIGTVEGLLEGLIIHGKRRFLVYDSLTDRQIVCYFTPKIDWENALRAFGKRVAVSGFIRSRSSGEKVSILANRLYVFPIEDELPSADDVLGAAQVSQ